MYISESTNNSFELHVRFPLRSHVSNVWLTDIWVTGSCPLKVSRWWGMMIINHFLHRLSRILALMFEVIVSNIGTLSIGNGVWIGRSKLESQLLSSRNARNCRNTTNDTYVLEIWKCDGSIGLWGDNCTGCPGKVVWRIRTMISPDKMSILLWIVGSEFSPAAFGAFEETSRRDVEFWSFWKVIIWDERQSTRYEIPRSNIRITKVLSEYTKAVWEMGHKRKMYGARIKKRAIIWLYECTVYSPIKVGISAPLEATNIRCFEEAELIWFSSRNTDSNNSRK